MIDTLVSSYDEINERMEEGTHNRTVASTNMNATSSRAHTIVGITFIQKSKNAAGKEMAKNAVVNLVDLAGRSVLAKEVKKNHPEMVIDYSITIAPNYPRCHMSIGYVRTR